MKVYVQSDVKENEQSRCSNLSLRDSTAHVIRKIVSNFKHHNCLSTSDADFTILVPTKT